MDHGLKETHFRAVGLGFRVLVSWARVLAVFMGLGTKVPKAKANSGASRTRRAVFERRPDKGPQSRSSQKVTEGIGAFGSKEGYYTERGMCCPLSRS